jgi:CheY-like chemotaxis protein
MTQATQPTSTSTGRGPVLVIDDDQEVLRMLTRFLGSRGFTVATTSTPFGATNLAAQIRPCVVLIDYQMPGLNGSSLSAIMRRHPACAGVPLLLYSASPVSVLENAVKEGLADGYFQKGEPVSKLVDQINHLVQQRPPEPPPAVG